MWLQSHSKGRGTHVIVPTLCLKSNCWLSGQTLTPISTYPSRLPWNPGHWGLRSDRVLPFQEKSAKLTKLQPPRVKPSRFPKTPKQKALWELDISGQEVCVWVRGVESVNRDQTEMETGKMWRRSSSALRPAAAENSNDTCFQKTENFKNWSQSWSRSRNKKSQAQEILVVGGLRRQSGALEFQGFC